MAHDPEIDAVVIGLPNYLHAPVTIQMLEAGKHVLCEKPMAMTVAEAERMVEASQRTGRKLMIAHMWRFDHEYSGCGTSWPVAGWARSSRSNHTPSGSTKARLRDAGS